MSLTDYPLWWLSCQQYENCVDPSAFNILGLIRSSCTFHAKTQSWIQTETIFMTKIDCDTALGIILIVNY